MFVASDTHDEINSAKSRRSRLDDPRYSEKLNREDEAIAQFAEGGPSQ